MNNMAEVLIIGAGPAGLTAAYKLARLGRRATLLEADDQVGGLARVGPLFFFALIGTGTMWLQKERWHHLSLLCMTILSFAIGYSFWPRSPRRPFSATQNNGINPWTHFYFDS